MPKLQIATSSFPEPCLGNDASNRRSSYAPYITPISPNSSRLLHRAKWATRLSVPEATSLPAGRVDSSLFQMILQRGRDRGGSYPVIDALYPSGSPRAAQCVTEVQKVPFDACPPTPSSTVEKVEPLSPTAEGKCRITVAVRVRPFARTEANDVGTPFLAVYGTKVTLQDPNAKSKSQPPHHFTFDAVLCAASRTAAAPSSQEAVYERLGGPLLENLVRGYNACLLCYGQTGSGKTYTMMGTPCDPGIMPRCAEAVFQSLESNQKANGCAYLVQVSFIEIYNEKVHDLLAGKSPQASQKNLRVRQHPVRGPFVEGLTQHAVASGAAILTLLRQGNDRRATAATRMNDRSSRSHAILTLTLTQQAVISQPNSEDLFSSKTSYMHLVDLAGSERMAKSNINSSPRFQELAAINLSLTTLSRVIEALSDPSSTVRPPYRESLLTWLLADSFGGNSKTTMIATVSPALSNASETLSTLRYASRARKIVNKAVINEDPSAALISSLQVETQQLRAQLAEMAEKNFLLLESRPSAEEVERLRHKLSFSEKLIEELRQHEESERQAWELRFQRRQCDEVSEMLEAQQSCQAAERQLEAARAEVRRKAEEVAALHQALAEMERQVDTHSGPQQHVQNESNAKDVEGPQPELPWTPLDCDRLAHQNAELRAALEREVALREVAVQERHRWESQAKAAERRLLGEPAGLCKHGATEDVPCEALVDEHGASREAEHPVVGQHPVAAIKSVALDIQDEVKAHNKILEGMVSAVSNSAMERSHLQTALACLEDEQAAWVPGVERLRWRKEGSTAGLAQEVGTQTDLLTADTVDFTFASIKPLCFSADVFGTALFSAEAFDTLKVLEQNMAAQLSINQQLAKELRCLEQERDFLQVQLKDVSEKLERALGVVRRLHNERDRLQM